MLRDGNPSIKELRDALKVTHPDMLRICRDLTEKGCFLHTICSANACNNTEGSRGWKSTLAAEFPCFLQNKSGQRTKTVPGGFKTPQSPPRRAAWAEVEAAGGRGPQQEGLRCSHPTHLPQLLGPPKGPWSSKSCPEDTAGLSSFGWVGLSWVGLSSLPLATNLR